MVLVLDYIKDAIIDCSSLNKETEDIMAWNAPKVVEIALGAEINSYACADLKK